jgi:GNAT superfamily N-acetyltransferase
MARLYLVQADVYDAMSVWKLRDERLVRAVSRNTDPIPYEDHVEWYAGHCHEIVIPRRADTHDPIGYARVSPGEHYGAGVISVAIAPPYRRKGYGVELIKAASRWFMVGGESPGKGYDYLLAFIKDGNEDSLGAFEQAGYEWFSQTPGWTCKIKRSTNNE